MEHQWNNTGLPAGWEYNYRLVSMGEMTFVIIMDLYHDIPQYLIMSNDEKMSLGSL